LVSGYFKYQVSWFLQILSRGVDKWNGAFGLTDIFAASSIIGLSISDDDYCDFSLKKNPHQSFKLMRVLIGGLVQG